MKAPTTCTAFAYWWDGEYEGTCALPSGHHPTDIHWDGMSWFNDDNEQVDDTAVPANLAAALEVN